MTDDFEAFVRRKYEKITKKLISDKKYITTMESCSSGLIASLITDTEGASAIMKGAFVTYSNEAKIKQGVPASVIEAHGVYSLETASQMALAAKRVYGADYSVGVTGTMGNVDPANSDSIPGRVYYAIAYDDAIICKEVVFPPKGSRNEYKLAVADVIADELFKLLNI